MWLASHAAVQLNIQLNSLKECLLLIKFVIKLKTVTKKVDKHPNLISHNRESDSNNVSAVTSKNTCTIECRISSERVTTDNSKIFDFLSFVRVYMNLYSCCSKKDLGTS